MIDQYGSSMGVSAYRNPSNPICSISSTGPNANTDCEGSNPHNETSIAVNPANPLNIIGGANDYQEINTGMYDYITAYTRAHVTFDGGKTWTTVGVDVTGGALDLPAGLPKDASFEVIASGNWK